MANSFITTDLVAREAVMAFNNSLVLMNHVDTQHTSEFSTVGDTIRIRQRQNFTVTTGEALGPLQTLENGTRALVLNIRKQIPFAVSSKELTLDIDNFSNTYIKPAMVQLAQEVDLAIGDLYTSIYNFTGTPGTTPSTALQVAEVATILNEIGVPQQDQRSVFYESKAMFSIANTLKLVFPNDIARKAIERGMVAQFMGLRMFPSDILPVHTVGVATGAPLVNGAGQNVTYTSAKLSGSQTLNTDGWTPATAGILNAGDVITIAGVNSVNANTFKDTGRLQSFVVKTTAASGAGAGPAALTISPAIITSGAYQTVTAAPANNAVITVMTGAGGSTHKQNLAWHKNAITLAVAPLELPTAGAKASNASENGVTIRVVEQYSVATDQTTWRFDILFGVLLQNEAFAIRHTS